MIYSLIISLLILGIAAFFGMQRSEHIAQLETKWAKLVKKSEAYEIPKDPEVAYAPRMTRKRADRVARRDMVNDYSVELAAFMKEMKEAQKNGEGDQVEFQKRGMEMMSRMFDFSPSEIKLLVENIIADDSIEEQSKKELAGMTIMMMSQEQPELALAMILETKDTLLKGDRMGNHFVGMAIGNFAKSDPLAALEWIKEHEEEIGGVTDQMRRQVLMGAASQDIKAALDIADELDFKNKAGVFGMIGHSVTADNVGDFISAARGVKDDDGKALKLFRSLGSSQLIRDFDEATKLLEGPLLSAEERESVTEGIHYYQVKDDTARWLGWLSDQEGDRAQSTSGNILRQWTREDYRAAGEWVNTLDKGEERNSAVTNYASALLAHEPAAAVVWAETLPDGKKRTDLIEKIHQSWQSKDPEAAAALGEKYGLGE